MLVILSKKQTEEPSPGGFNYFIQYQYLYCFTFTPGNTTQYTVTHSTIGHLIANICLFSITLVLPSLVIMFLWP